MADKERSPPAVTSATASPEPKRVKTSLPDGEPEAHVSPQEPSAAAVKAQVAESTPTPSAIPTEPLPEDDEIEADDAASIADSAFTSGTLNSETTTLSSAVYKGYVENGRRYASGRDDNYYCPSDDKQFEVMANTHLMYLILDSQRKNPLFQSPLDKNAQNVLDLGTGDGTWPLAVADRFPNLTVHGIDLFPPPTHMVTPNCILEVDDMLKPWTWPKQWDLVHLRGLMGACTPEEWRKLYHQVYKNVKPGGWIEQMEGDINILCDDGTMPKDSHLASVGEIIGNCGIKSGKRMDAVYTMKQSIIEAGFINVQECDYKLPTGTWPKHPVYKDAGVISREGLKSGMHGYVTMFLTRWGSPQPWSAEEVTVYVAKIRQELDQNWHIYQRAKRVWAQKPFDAPKVEQKPVLETVA